MDIEQHRARSVGIVGGVRFAARELPQKIGIHRACRKLAVFGARPRARHRVENPFQLGSGKVGVARQARFRVDKRLAVALFELVGKTRGAAALPHDGVVHRLARSLVPHDNRFALIGYAHCGDVAGGGSRLFHNAANDAHRALVDFARLVLHPTGERIVLL